ncbi:MAG TPA: arsenical-resistance protein, partial [Methyloradius sp.]
MSAECEAIVNEASNQKIGFFERNLTVWVFVCIAVGIALGHFMPRTFIALGEMKIAEVNLP